MPEISIVIPTHNRWSLLRRTLAGALAQEDVDHEVIVVDDGSGDETPARLAELEEPRLHVLRNPSAKGVANARNLGLENARGSWVAFLDDDDLWSPRKLRCQLDAPNAGDAAIVYTGAIMIDADLEIVDRQDAPEPEGMLDELLSRQAIPGGCSNLITRTELARQVGGFDTKLKVAEDWDMWMRLLLAGKGRAARCDEFHYGYYQHGVSSVLLNKDVIESDYERITAKFAEARRERGVEIDSVNISRWLAKNYRRAGDRRGAIRIYLRAAREHRDFGNVVRAAGVLVGEKAMRRLSPYQPEPMTPPAWLDLYRPGGRLESVAIGPDPA
ncbi:MAG TPA: glycosyltransferase family A protein [Solirubrobacterales bacterium]